MTRRRSPWQDADASRRLLLRYAAADALPGGRDSDPDPSTYDPHPFDDGGGWCRVCGREYDGEIVVPLPADR